MTVQLKIFITGDEKKAIQTGICEMLVTLPDKRIHKGLVSLSMKLPIFYGLLQYWLARALAPFWPHSIVLKHSQKKNKTFGSYFLVTSLFPYFQIFCFLPMEI